MEALTAPSSSFPTQQPYEPNTESIKRKLLNKGVYPTPKIVHNLRKKQIQKHNRKLNKIAQTQQPLPLAPSQKQALAEESHFQALKREYKDFTKALAAKPRAQNGGMLVGKPWERIERVRFKEIASGSKEFNGEKLKKENLRDLKEIFEDNLKWILDKDVELVEDDDDLFRAYDEEKWDPGKQRRHDERETIRFLVDRLSSREVSVKDWKLARIMKQSGLRFSEGQLLRILDGLAEKGKWGQAMAVVEWVYNDKERRDSKSRFVYTKLLSVLGKQRRAQEALHIFNVMQEDCNVYPDMAAYHSIAVTLGQAGLLKELLKIIECMRQKPSKRIRNMPLKKWDPALEPDLVVYNAILNACVPAKQWKGAWWVFEQLRKSGLRPNGATYGLAMEVMLQAGKYGFVHEFFKKMNRSGEAPKALTYKGVLTGLKFVEGVRYLVANAFVYCDFPVLVRACWEEGKINEAEEAVEDMEQRGIVGAASVYYELACCLCSNGRWQDAMLEVEKMKKLRHCKPLEVAFTGMIMSAMYGGHINDCISIFENMKAHCAPNIGTINTMLKVYGRSDLFSEAKELFEEIKGANGRSVSITPDEFTYSLMLEACARALQWEYFEFVYKEMALSGYQLDQSKHASLLVEASRAGKVHLLEHAFDTILEAGDIPHSLFFTEMVFQATVQHNYERAVTLVSAMAHAPFEVSERQWTDLFEKNGDKISQDSLEKLLDALGNCGIASEITVLNLSRTLHSLCGLDKSRDLSSSSASGIEDTGHLCLDTGYNEQIADNKRANMPSSSPSTMNGDSGLGRDLVNKADTASEMFAKNHCITSREGGDDSDMASNSQNCVSNPDVATTNQCTNMEVFADDVAYGASTDCLVKELSSLLLEEPSEDVDEVELEILRNDVGDSHECNLPSASEILDTWKESRKKDGMFFAFQLSRERVSISVQTNVK